MQMINVWVSSNRKHHWSIDDYKIQNFKYPEISIQVNTETHLVHCENYHQAQIILDIPLFFYCSRCIRDSNWEFHRHYERLVQF